MRFIHLTLLVCLSANIAHAQTGTGTIQIKPSRQTDLDNESAPVTQIFSHAEQMPKPGYDLQEYFDKNLVAPDTVAQNNLKGSVKVQFVVNEDGSISGTKVVNSMCKECDEEALKLISKMPAWQPGKENGSPVKVYATQPVLFNGSSRTFTYVDQMPEPGYNFDEYRQKNLRYPAEAREKNIQGRVIVQFVIDEDGTISSCKVIKGIGGGCDEEALRIIANMPPWKPGKQGGKAVKVIFTTPVNFMLTSR